MVTIASQTAVSLEEIASQTRNLARKLALLPTTAKNEAIEAIAKSLETAAPEILAANQTDCQTAVKENIPKPLLARLQLSETKLKAAIAQVRNVAKLPDPIGVLEIKRELDEGLFLKRVSCPVGVLGVIFEARPDALIQITTLAIKSGNGVILKGGKEAINTCLALIEAIHRGLAKTRVTAEAVQLLTTRAEIKALLSLDKYVDLIVPRGSNSFVRYVQENTSIPVLGHADGICHLYIDCNAAIDKVLKITLDAKTQYPAACNTIETLLVHQDIAKEFLPQIAAVLQQDGVELRADAAARKFIDVAAATESDWVTEYSDLILSIKLVESLDSAIDHINTYGSKHTDAIVTEDDLAAANFLDRVDAANVFHNCSTRFADGFRYGFGAEVGISTQKMPPRGPVGLEGLVTYKYQVTGKGHIAADYTGENAKSFTHRDL